ncbi:MAG TPA: hypothetical protein VKB86_03770, partial [Pyrinomonadaceae bacterium]|nr:hypothetical protein [Pyrinomonadaceae bacterium]
VFDPAPLLLTEPGTQHAIALDSVTMFRDPFPVATTSNFSADHRTRISIFVADLELMPTENSSAISVQAEDNESHVYPLTIEYVGKMPDLDWMTQIVVKLPDEITNAQQVWLTVRLRDVVSNRAFINIKPSALASSIESYMRSLFNFDTTNGPSFSANNMPMWSRKLESLLFQMHTPSYIYRSSRLNRAAFNH